jgi:hypothetical protein
MREQEARSWSLDGVTMDNRIIRECLSDRARLSQAAESDAVLYRKVPRCRAPAAP